MKLPNISVRIAPSKPLLSVEHFLIDILSQQSKVHIFCCDLTKRYLNLEFTPKIKDIEKKEKKKVKRKCCS